MLVSVHRTLMPPVNPMLAKPVKDVPEADSVDGC